MNFYVIDADPYACAAGLDDASLPFQIADVTSGLATATDLRHTGATESEFYPCAIWAASSPRCWAWTWLLLSALHDEHEHRFSASRPSRQRLMALLVRVAPSSTEQRKLRTLGLTAPPKEWPPISTAGIRTGIADPHERARQELRWKYAAAKARGRPPKWTKRDRPEWLGDGFEVLGGAR